MILLRWFHSLKSAYVKENFPLLQSLLFPLHHYLLLFFLLSTFDDIINEFQVHLKVVKHLIWSFFRCHLNFPIHSWQNWMVNLIATAETAYFAPLLYSIYSFFQCGRWIANIYVSWRVHCILIRLVCLIFVWAVRSIRGVNVVICFVIRLQFTFSMSGSFFSFYSLAIVRYKRLKRSSWKPLGLMSFIVSWWYCCFVGCWLYSHCFWLRL